MRENDKYLNLGGSIVSKNIIEGKGVLTWCYRNEPVNDADNGWAFFSDIDTDEFLESVDSVRILSWAQVVEIEPAVAAIFDFPFGCELELVDEDGEKHFYDANTGIKII